MAVDSHRPMVVRDRESEDLPVKLLFTLHKSEEFDDTPHRHGHAVSILPICDIKCCGTALNLARQEREVHVVCSHEERNSLRNHQQKAEAF